MLTMTEYIEREALLRSIADDVAPFNVAMVFRHIHNAPAADVAPVIRCKDCEYWQDNNGGYPNEECRWREDETPDADDFCSYGKRKDGDDNAGD